MSDISTLTFVKVLFTVYTLGAVSAGTALAQGDIPITFVSVVISLCAIHLMLSLMHISEDEE